MSIDGIGDLHGPKRISGPQSVRKAGSASVEPARISGDSYEISEESRINLLRQKIEVLAKDAPEPGDRTELINDLKKKINDPLYNESVLRELASRIAESLGGQN
ncbi:MAG TPA: flagellar biosynthesis anti-sigma factor FlgM [Spirochaetota bacterium]|nr:flagellar biosynthesis anti-sigma factor FlgM [Spirochaetota bacterium]